MGKRIAVALVHGIGAQTEAYLNNSGEGLIQRTRELCGDDVVFKWVFWAPVLQEREDRLLKRLKSADAPINWNALRGFIVSYFGDAIAYQPTEHDRNAYIGIHEAFARTMRDLSDEAGLDAPLVIVGHSLGAIIASNYIWDLQHMGRRDLIPDQARSLMTDTPLELGHTLTAFYSLGAAFPLWSLRFDDFGEPINVPAPELAAIHPTIDGEWVNYYDRDDVLGYPLRPMNDAYAQAVTKDCEVNVGRFYQSWNPLSHIAYWRDNNVISPVSEAIARIYRTVNQPEMHGT